MLIRNVAFTVLTLASLTSFAQVDPSNERMNLADQYFQNGDYGQALGVLEAMKHHSASNPLIDYKIGVCYAQSPNDKKIAALYLERALHSNDPRLPAEIYFYLGKVYHLTYRFIEAVNMLTQFKETPGRQAALYQEADQIIKYCQSGQALLGRRSPKVSVEFMKFPINTSYNDFASLISNDGRIMAFSSDRLKNRFDLVYADQYTFLPDSLQKGTNDIFLSYLIEENNWTHPDPSGLDGKNVTSLSISDDAGKLWYYQETDDRKGINVIERKKGAKWQKPEAMNVAMFNGYPIKGASFTSDGKVMYFASKRPDSFGGYDIYWSIKINSKRWSEPTNLGPEVNSSADEINPFMHADNRTLYFSSNGHNSMGYLDIFYTKKDGAGWKKASNMGFPINSTFNDDHFIISTDNEHIYLSSDRNEEGAMGQYDILRIFLQKDDVPITKVDGKIKVLKDGVEIPVHLQVEEVLSGANQQYVFNPHPKTGEHFMVLFPDNTYRIKVLFDPEFKTTPEGYVARYDSANISQIALDETNPEKNSIELTVAIPDSAYHYRLDLTAKKETISLFGVNIAEKIEVTDSFHVYKANQELSEENPTPNRYDALLGLLTKILEYKDTLSLNSIQEKLKDETPFALREEENFNTMLYMLDRMGEAVNETDIQMVIDLKRPLGAKDRLKLLMNVEPKMDVFGRNIYQTGDIVYERNNARFDAFYEEELQSLVKLMKTADSIRVDMTHLQGINPENNIVAGKRMQAILAYLRQNGIEEYKIRTFYSREEDPTRPVNRGNSPVVRLVIYTEP